MIHLFEYDHWANRQMLEAVMSQGIEDEKISYWLNHIVNAKMIWLQRIEEGESDLPVHEPRSLDVCLAALDAIHRAYMSFFSQQNEPDLDEVIAYHNTQGFAFETSIRDILIHVVNHGTHHRAQVAARLRELGGSPPKTDYIHYIR